MALRKKQINYNTNLKDSSKAAQKVANDLLSMQQTLDKIAGKTGGEYYKAWTDYQGGLDEVDKAAKKYIADGVPLEQVQEFVTKATQELTENFDAQTQAMRNANDVTAILSLAYAKSESNLNEHIRLLGLNKEAAEADALANKLINDALGDMKNFIGPLTEAQQAEIDRLTALAHGYVAQKTAVEQSNEATKEWVSIWQQAGDSLATTFANILVNGGSLFDGLVSLAKQTVQQIIAYFAKLAVINPILNAIFGGSAGFSLLPTLGGAAESIGGAAITGGTSGASGARLESQRPRSIRDGQTIWSGFQKGLDGLHSSGGIAQFTMGPPDGQLRARTSETRSTGVWPDLCWRGIAGGIYAGYNEFQNAGGGAAGAAGGLAYGYGTYAAGIGGAAALSGGLSAGLAAIGPSSAG